MTIAEKAAKARKAGYLLGALDESRRTYALEKVKAALQENKAYIFEQNKIDIDKARQEGLSKPLLGRLGFDEKKLKDVSDGIDSLIRLPDMVGRAELARELTPGLNLYKIVCPIGVLGVIFESRPDALVQIAALCIKSGNAVLLKGGHEAACTNKALFDIVYNASVNAGLAKDWAVLLESRQDVNEMLCQDGMIDLIIPRGSNSFVRYIMEHTHIPVMGHADGICHVYVDRDADIDMAVKVVLDSKTQNLSVCNAAETLLVHESIAEAFLPRMKKAFDEKGVQVRGDKHVQKIIDCVPMTDEDRRTEYLDAIISAETVNDVQQAIDYINTYGSHHTDSIVTDNAETADLFTRQVDSAGVYVNCSTRFADGFRYGFGAEVGVSTQKLHARGPVGVEGLCTYKYKLIGSGQTVGEVMTGKISFTHKDLPL